jgi:protein-disulfide isomerase
VTKLKLLDLLATVLVIVAAGSVIAKTFWYQPNDSSLRPVRNAVELPLPAAPQSLDGAATVGKQTANVAVIQYSDFECPFCAMFARDTLRDLKKDYAETGKVLLAFRNLPLPSHPNAKLAAMSAACAAEQGQFWEMHDLLFARQGKLTDKIADELAATIGLNDARFTDCFHNRGDALVRKDVALATAIGVNATPTFIIGKVHSNGQVTPTRVLVGSHSIASFRTVLDELVGGGSWSKTWLSRSWLRRP